MRQRQGAHDLLGAMAAGLRHCQSGGKGVAQRRASLGAQPLHDDASDLGGFVDIAGINQAVHFFADGNHLTDHPRQARDRGVGFRNAAERAEA